MAIGKKPLFSEPKVLITGVEGAGKTLFAVQQSDLLAQAEGGQVYQVNIRGADPHHLPKLPFDLREMSTTVDPETGDLLPRWAVDLDPGTVVIVDECHKVYPQRGPGRPPKDIEMLGEGRQKGIRFVYLSQSPDSIDSFLRERISRHFHLERRGNMQRATVFEFDHYVFRPRTAWQERKDATVHFWAYPKEYFGWYTSAKSHHFQRRIPWKIFAAMLFVPAAVYAGYRVWDKVGALTTSPAMTAVASPAGAAPGTQADKAATGKPDAPTMDYEKYLLRFSPVVPAMPWSAPVYQGREVAAQPDLFCMASDAGTDATGNRREASCTCLTEQGTRYNIDQGICTLIAREGNYNPYRAAVPSSSGGAGDKPVEARTGPSGVSPPPVLVGVGGDEPVAAYGAMRNRDWPMGTFDGISR